MAGLEPATPGLTVEVTLLYDTVRWVFDRTRSGDLLLHKQTLFQLSYKHHTYLQLVNRYLVLARD
jgi:hypothetical protein